MSERREYNEETKAAVMAALLSGQSVSHVATTYRIPLGTVKRWSAAAKELLEPVRAEKRERIGDLLIAYVEANLEALRSQAEAFKDAEWIKKQSASEAAVLHGVLADKAVRLLEALADSDPDDPGTEDAPAE